MKILYRNKVFAEQSHKDEIIRENNRKLRKAHFEILQRQFAIDQHAIVTITNLEGTITYANERFCKISEYSNSEVIGKTHRIINSGYHNKEFFQNMYSSLNQGLVWHGEIRNRTKNGSYYWVATTIAPIKNDDGEIEQYFAIQTDITNRKQIEENLEAHQRELETQNQVLQHYMKVLEDINRTKDQFFNIIAHDLRNPFVGILGISDLIESKILRSEDENSKRLLKYIKLIQTGSKSAFELLENLLLWARSQTGEISAKQSDISLNHFILLTISIVNGNAYKKKITIETELSETDKVFADEFFLSTILRNIITNAIKFTCPNGKIIVSTANKREFIEISIADTGIGIDSEALKNLFRIDSKSSKLGTENEKGTGLGLILCKEFVEKQGGQIWAESELGRGSKFTFTLPLARQI